MLGNFLSCLPVTLGYEGGWSDHPRDPGGATMKGITLAVYRQYRPGASKADLRAISDGEVEAIYRDGYWTPIRGDDLPAGVDLATFDFGVNSGVSRASRYLQSVVGVQADGKIGNVTVQAAKEADAKTVVKALCAKRLSFLHGLSTFGTFGKGWSRRVANVEARAVAMTMTAGAAMTSSVRMSLLGEAAAAYDDAKASNQKAGGAVAGGTTVGGVEAVASGEPNWILIAVLASAVIAALAVFIARSRHHTERAKAYTALVIRPSQGQS